MTDRYALIGNPVAHSFSPRIHSLFAKHTGEDVAYELILAPRDGFTDAITTFANAGGKGVNVTLPFKNEAFQIADERSERATMAKAVNTLVFRSDGVVYADNTDGVGLVDDLRRLNCAIESRCLLIVGAGGACQGIIPALLKEQPKEIVIINRTPARAVAVAEHFAQFGPVIAREFSTIHQWTFDGVINATSASLDGGTLDLPDALTGKLSWGYELAYAKQPTPFMRWLADRGVTAVYDGIGMLVAQAAASFELWRGVKPNVEKVLEELEL